MAELTRRYLVMPLATEAPFDVSDPDGPFVLKPWKDPAALRALAAYRDNCYPELARELDQWIRTVKAGPTVRGGMGKRNEPYVKPEGGRAPAKARARARARPKPKPRPRKRAKKGRRH
jgi:hypothetical protein